MVEKNEQKEHSMMSLYLNMSANILFLSVGMWCGIAVMFQYEANFFKIVFGTTLYLMYTYRPSDKKEVNYYNLSKDRLNFNIGGGAILSISIMGFILWICLT